VSGVKCNVKDNQTNHLAIADDSLGAGVPDLQQPDASPSVSSGASRHPSPVTRHADFVRWCERGMAIGWYLVWFILPFSKAGVEIGSCLAIACWWGKRLLLARTEGMWRWTEQLGPARWPLVWFLLICAVTIFTGVRPEQSASALWRKTLEYAAMFVVTTEVVRDRRHFRWLVLLLLISGVAMGGDAIYQHLTRRDWLRGHLLMAERVTGPFEMPSDFGAYLISVVPIVAMVALAGVRMGWLSAVKGVVSADRSSTERSDDGVWRVGVLSRRFRMVCLAVTGLMFWSLAESVSRGAWFALASVGLVLAAIRSRRLFAAAFVGLLLLTWSLPDSITSHLVEAITVGDAASQQRVAMWAITWKMITDRPLLGHGLGVYMWNLGNYGITPDNVLMINYAHNCYLQMWAEIGIFGLAAFVWLIGVTLVLGVKRWLSERDPFMRAVTLGIVAGLSALLIHSGVDTDLYSLQLATMGWIMMGLAFAAARYDGAATVLTHKGERSRWW